MTLFEYLCCPACKSDFKPHGEQIHCIGCGAQYPVIKGIPRILPAEQIADNYSRNFQYYWLNMNWHQPPANKQRFYELTEWKPEDIRGKVILDAGCGGGRWVYQFAEEGAAEIVALDYTLAVERAAEICNRFNNIHYVQADLFNMPLKEGMFDIVHCHGVLMATPDPKAGVRSLGKRVKPGGELAVLLYRNLTPPQRLVDNLTCGITKRLPTRLVYWLSLIPTLIEYIPGAVFLFENIVHLSGQPNFTMKWLHNFDWYTCTYRHRNSPAELKQWMAEFGFRDVKILNTNDFRTRSRFAWLRRFKEKLLDIGWYLKATLGVRATRS